MRMAGRERGRGVRGARSAGDTVGTGGSRGRKRSGGDALDDRLIAGVPARIMRPRLVFGVCLFAILAFGLLMVYSSSSVEALSEEGSSTYYLVRQALFMLVGLVAFAVICSGAIPWEVFRSAAAWGLWLIVVILLALVPLIGSTSGGATRWISFGSISLQPSELAKPVVILLASKIFADYYEDCSIDTGTFLLEMVVVVGVPAVLILIEPDFGTAVIILATIFLMAYLAGISYRLVWAVVVGFVLLVVVAVVQEPYRLTRILVALDPWSDPYGDGYQATLAIMAFASGGLFGRGIGNSTMKYSYLPEAHTDYILAVIGEELGFVGTTIFIVVYLAMIFAAFSIARQAPTLHQQILASGCAIIILVQFFINALGILSVIPMTGKPMPFISYGGSSMVSSLILAALIMRVSLESEVETVHTRRRADLTVMSGGSEGDLASSHLGTSTAGRPHKRSARGADDGTGRGGFTVHDGGRSGRVRDRGNNSDSGSGGAGFEGGYSDPDGGSGSGSSGSDGGSSSSYRSSTFTDQRAGRYTSPYIDRRDLHDR